jgi:hypothetical protein
MVPAELGSIAKATLSPSDPIEVPKIPADLEAPAPIK